MPIGPAQQYLAKYNNFVLPGYVQSESFDSSMNIATHSAPYADGGLSEYTGLENKRLTVRLKVWEADYQAVKDTVEDAATYLRSKRSGFAPLYLQYTNRYYDAMVETVRFDKSAGESVRTGEYEVSFNCRPWLIDDSTQNISGTGTLSTAGRTIADGGWTPTTVTVTGTNVTISGYTATEPFTGFISISGAVSNMIIDSEAYTATIGGVNKNNLVKNVDYQLYVAPEVTYFAVTGASACSIDYKKRWYL